LLLPGKLNKLTLTIDPPKLTLADEKSSGTQLRVRRTPSSHR